MLLAVVIGYSILAFDRGDKKMPKILTPFGFVGRYCYGVYVYSAFIGVIYLKGWNIQPGMKAFVLQMMGIPIAVLSYKIFEKKFLALKS